MKLGGLVAMDSGKVRLEFAAADGRLVLRSLADAGGTEWVGEPDRASRLWALRCQGPEGSVREIWSGDATLSATRLRKRRVAFTWTAPLGGAAATVTMSVRCPKGSAFTAWSLRATLPLGWQVERADFPMLPGLRRDAARKLAAPQGWGLEYDLEPGVTYEGTYPSCTAGMQFIAFYGGGRGLYIGLHDVAASHKVLRVEARQEGIGFACVTWPALSAKGGGTYAAPYEATVGVFEGDGCRAARFYREFTFRTRWGSAGPVAGRAIPRWLKETDLWLLPDSEPGANVETCRAAGRYFGVPIALHWYNWHQIPFDTLYPDYFPAKEGFIEGVKALHAAGFPVMPYINGRLADRNSRFWEERQGEAGAARQENGELHTEVYGSKVPLQVMCPQTETWQVEVVSLVDRLVNQCGVDGVYIDQIGAAHPVRCLDAGHGHPRGGGRFWVDAYRKMLERARAKLPPGRAITTEENAECWIDQLDALLVVNTATVPTARPIPLFPAVYAGRTITFGFQYIASDDLARSLPFRAKMARAFAWGAQLGWIAVGSVMAPEAAKEAEFLRNLARCRRHAHRFLAEGCFLGMQEVGGDSPRVRGEGSGSFGGTYPIDLPAVLASEWRADDGCVAVALANLSDDPHTVDVKLPTPKAGRRMARRSEVEVYGPEGRVGDTRSGAAQRVTVEPRSALIVAERDR